QPIRQSIANENRYPLPPGPAHLAFSRASHCRSRGASGGGCGPGGACARAPGGALQALCPPRPARCQTVRAAQGVKDMWLDRLSAFIARYKGLPTMLAVLLVILNFVLQFFNLGWL